MSIRVGDLASHLRKRSRSLSAKVGSIELMADGDAAGTLRVGDDFLPWGEETARVLLPRIKAPSFKYVLNESLDWQRTVITHHVEKHRDSDLVWYIEGERVAGAYEPGEKFLPLTSIADQVTDVFYPDDVVDVLFGPDQVELNVVSKVRTVTVPGIPGVESRPVGEVVPWDDLMVGDISAGGVRIIAQPAKPERGPSVEEFWLRVACKNGLTRRVSGSLINLRGRTVPEILQEMNNVMRVIWEGLDHSGRSILHSANTPVPGAVSDFIRVVAEERGGINDKHILALQRQAAALHANPSVYDVTQLFTALANDDAIPVVTRRNLQALGGDLVVDTQRMVHRCAQCEQPIKAA